MNENKFTTELCDRDNPGATPFGARCDPAFVSRETWKRSKMAEFTNEELEAELRRRHIVALEAEISFKQKALAILKEKQA